jgi:REP element-mobilizing transposase RayT
MAFNALHGHSALRRGRNSETSANYFLTVCTANQQTGLIGPEISKVIWSEITFLEIDQSWQMRCAVLMPDHLHVLIRLGERLSLGQTIQRLKAKTSSALRTASLNWERGFFDRKLRPDEPLLPVFLYVYLNPYRANLCKPSESWPEYRCGKDDWAWFCTQLTQNLPFPEWLA